MKQIYSIIGIIILSPALAAAQELALPFQLEIRADNEAAEARLIFGYGREVFNICDKGTVQDKLNPYLYSKLLRETEYCLQGRDAQLGRLCYDNKIDSAGTCIIIDTGCKERYGEFSHASGNIINGNNECACVAGYVWNEDRSACVAPCPENLLFYSVYRDQNNNLFQPFCKEPDLACQEEFGPFSRFAGRDDRGRTACACVDNSSFDRESGACPEPVLVAGFEAAPADIDYALTIERERANSFQLDINLSRRLSGRILLQVQERGEAWYVNPDDNYRYYLATPSKAFEVMRSLGLGARHEFIAAHEFYPARVWGKILIDVDDRGKAYYINPLDRRAYYLGSPESAHRVMRELGLGISNEDIRKIFVAG